MSILSEQVKRLHKLADEIDRIKNTNTDLLWRDAGILLKASIELHNAADTIDELRSRCQEMQEKEWQSGSLQTCLMETTNASDYDWRCDECGEHVSMCSGKPRFCPSCGRKAVS